MKKHKFTFSENEMNLMYDWANGSTWAMSDKELKEMGWGDSISLKQIKYNFYSDITEIPEYNPELIQKWEVDFDFLRVKIIEMDYSEFIQLKKAIENFWKKKFPLKNPN